MKANEFAKFQTRQKIKKPAPVSTPVAPEKPLTEKKLKFKIPAQLEEVSDKPVDYDILPYDVKVEPGSQMEIIRQTNPELWSKILNWD